MPCLALGLLLVPCAHAQQPAPPELAALKGAHEEKLVAALAPLEALHGKLLEALKRTKEAAQQKADLPTALAAEEALNQLRATGMVSATKNPEVDRMRAILEQQTGMLASGLLGASTKVLTDYLGELDALKRRVPAAADGCEREVDQIRNDAKSLGQSRLPWLPAQGWADVLPDTQWQGNRPMESWDTNKVLLSEKREGAPKLITKQSYRPPFEFEATVIPDTTNVRFYYQKGVLIFNWEMNPQQFRVHDFFDNSVTPVNGKSIKPAVKQVLLFKILEDGFEVLVDGKPFHEKKQNLAALDAPVGIGPAHGSTLQVVSLRLRSGSRLRRLPSPITLFGTGAAVAASTPSTPPPVAPTSSTPAAVAMIPPKPATTTVPGAAPAAIGQQPTAEATWPRSVSTDGPPEVVVVEEDAAKKSFIYRSPHYEFVCDSRLGANVVREFGRIFEATYLVNCKLPLDIKPQPEKLKEFFTATLYTDKASYIDAGGVQGSAGIYSPGKKTLMVPLSSLGVKMVGSRVSLDYNDDDNRTLIHEITHQMMNHWLRKLPVWLIEGSADFVAMSKYDNGRFSFAQMDRQLPIYLARRGRSPEDVTLLSIADILAIEHSAWSAAVRDGDASRNYATAALLTYFFYLLDDKKDGAHIIACFRAIESGTDSKTAIETHLLRGRNADALEKEMTSAFRKEGVHLNFTTSRQSGSR